MTVKAVKAGEMSALADRGVLLQETSYTDPS